MVAAIERRQAVDGCGCIRCREVDPALVRRSTAGDLRWSLRLFRRRPSLLVLVSGSALAWTLSDPIIASFVRTTGAGAGVGTAIRTAMSLLLLVVLLRGYLGAVVADELTGRRTTHRRAAVYTARRLVPLLGTIAGLFSLVGLVLGVSILVVSVLVFDAGLFGPEIFDGVTPTLLFGSVIAPAFYKLWIAPDVCVVGGEGPITALRSSWRITRAHWRRICLLLASFAVTITAPYAVAELLAVVSGTPPTSIPGFDALRTQFQWLTTAVWYCVGAQIYARSALS